MHDLILRLYEAPTEGNARLLYNEQVLTIHAPTWRSDVNTTRVYTQTSAIGRIRAGDVSETPDGQAENENE